MFISREEAKKRLERGGKRSDPSSEFIRHMDAPAVESEVEESDEIIDQQQEDEAFDDLVRNALSIGEENEKRAGHVRGRPNQAHFANRLSEQKAIADVAVIAGDKVAQDLFGISVQQANAYEKGQRSSNRQMGLAGDGELLSHVTRTKENIRRIAAKKLEQTLEHLTDDKIEKTTKATDIGRLAKDLAAVHDKMERKDTGENGVQFHVFVPEVKQINNYNVIRVSSEPRDKEQIN